MEAMGDSDMSVHNYEHIRCVTTQKSEDVMMKLHKNLES
jgi:hypothetical protein